MDSGYNNYSSSYSGGGGSGGGFMPGEMNSPSGGKTDYTNATLRPITIKQALDAMQPYPEAPYQIDSAEVASVTFIGQVRNISSQSTNVTYKLDDGTGEIEAKQWIDSMTADSMDTDDPNNSTSNNKNQVELNGYARVFGKLKSFGNKRFVGAHCVRPVKDINELHCHLLEASAVHLFFTRGPSNAQSGAGAEGGGMKGGDSTMGGVGAAGDDYGAGKGLPAMSPVAKRVYHLLKTEPQSNEGLHAQLIAAKLSLPMPDVARAGDELLTAGVIFSTVDEHTWAILEF